MKQFYFYEIVNFQVGGMFTAAQIVAQGTITWLYLLNSIVIKEAFQILFAGTFCPKNVA